MDPVNQQHLTPQTTDLMPQLLVRARIPTAGAIVNRLHGARNPVWQTKRPKVHHNRFKYDDQRNQCPASSPP